MNTGLKVLIAVVVVAVIGAAGFFFLSSGDDTDANNTAQQETSQTTDPTEQQDEEAAQAVTIDDAIAQVGMTCESSGATEQTCTFEGTEYTLTQPADWETDANQRQQACDQGFVNSNYQILSDGSSFYFTTDQNEDLQPLSAELNDAGVEASVVAYCG